MWNNCNNMQTNGDKKKTKKKLQKKIKIISQCLSFPRLICGICVGDYGLYPIDKWVSLTDCSIQKSCCNNNNSNNNQTEIEYIIINDKFSNWKIKTEKKTKQTNERRKNSSRKPNINSTKKILERRRKNDGFFHVNIRFYLNFKFNFTMARRGRAFVDLLIGNWIAIYLLEDLRRRFFGHHQMQINQNKIYEKDGQFVGIILFAVSVSRILFQICIVSTWKTVLTPKPPPSKLIRIRDYYNGLFVETHTSSTKSKLLLIKNKNILKFAWSLFFFLVLITHNIWSNA